MSHKCLAGIVFGTAHGMGIALKVEGFKACHGHRRSGDIHSTAEGHGEGFCTGLQIHGLGTCEEERTADLDE